MSEETSFKHLDEKVCGPHCIAKDNGSGKYVSVRHCDQCHEEYDFAIAERPAHGKNYVPISNVPALVKDFTTNPLPADGNHDHTIDFEKSRLTHDEFAMTDPGIEPHVFIGRDDRWCGFPGCNRPDRNPIHLTPARFRLKSCVEQWPDCEEGMYDPRCCRFPKSCSCTVYSEKHVKPEDLVP